MTLRQTPYEGTPSDCYRAGLCPGCGGTGYVHRFVPVEGTYVCASCNGGGTLEAMEKALEGL